MKPILIQGAMDIEIETLIKKTNAIHDITVGEYVFYKGFVGGFTVIISKTNIGIANAAATTAIGIMKYRPCAIISQGTAGAHSENINKLDIVVGDICKNINSFEKPKSDEGVNYQNWIHTDFRHLEEDITPLVSDPKLLEMFGRYEYKKGKKHIGTLGSGDVWNKEKEFIKWLNKDLGTLSEDMETTAAYKIAGEFNVPVIGVRVISNNELLDQEYDPNAAIYLQEYIYKHLYRIARNMQ